ncbi:toll/interleukin-1 receptor domain-containing protein [Hymenobacter tibetensis]|uniref:Toll/interleukin-1 receptor domain-containing protein n=1 Tax=Hymenobacter tibetensis TaxID=497967 RepID=A0ABY4CZ61_9BACT|nr:toll/interleukin-1 receptor domain-containing protein [Hymenobacter tibetensis]UOG74336.1 toll/interleukin-1 receptor domain-containing protein [Hymenobacter tibetensis]
MEHKVFITYSWDDHQHKEWVRKLADDLEANGIETLLDVYALQPGDSITHFMNKSLEEAGKVVVVLTPNYRSRSLSQSGGVSYEQQIVSGEIMSGVERNKFIPIIRSGNFQGENCAIPPHFKGIYSINFKEDLDYNMSLNTLVRTIYNEPEFVKPERGSKPDFTKTNDYKRDEFTIDLNSDFSLRQSTEVFIDILSEISELRRNNSSYTLNYNIEQYSELHKELNALNLKRELTQEEVQRKNILREVLRPYYFNKGGNIYSQFDACINNIIDYSYQEYGYISSFKELAECIMNCLPLFSYEVKGKINNETGFDVFHKNGKWIYKIYINQEELKNLRGKVGVDSNLFLTTIAGLYTFDLSKETLLNQVIPKQAYSFMINIINKRVKDDDKEEYFRTGNWSIGIA